MKQFRLVLNRKAQCKVSDIYETLKIFFTQCKLANILCDKIAITLKNENYHYEQIYINSTIIFGVNFKRARSQFFF